MVKASDNRMRMRTSDPRHFEGVAPGATKHREEKVDTFETIPSENNVVLEEEMAKIAENNMNYQLTTSTYKKMISMFKIAIKGNAQ
jgi:flagellar basal-body rod protein FlgB